MNRNFGVRIILSIKKHATKIISTNECQKRGVVVRRKFQPFRFSVYNLSKMHNKFCDTSIPSQNFQAHLLRFQNQCLFLNENYKQFARFEANTNNAYGLLDCFDSTQLLRYGKYINFLFRIENN